MKKDIKKLYPEFMSEGMGMYIKNAPNKEIATLSMLKEAEKEQSLDKMYWADYMQFSPEDITYEKVEEGFYVNCRKCSSGSVGTENYECFGCENDLSHYKGKPCHLFLAEI